MTRIYTRTGDNGTTALVDGSRTEKTSPRLEAYGTVDELNAAVGIVIAFTPSDSPTLQTLNAIQNLLFDIGSALATDADLNPELAAKMFDRGPQAVAFLEKEIDILQAHLPRQTGFLLPQGTKAAAFAHQARTVCRRAERRILSLASIATVDPQIIKTVNRLSDYLFVLARFNNISANIAEINWQKNCPLENNH